MTTPRTLRLVSALAAAAAAGCASPPQRGTLPRPQPTVATHSGPVLAPPTPSVLTAAASEAAPPRPSDPLSLEALTQLALSTHPRLTQAGFSVEAARGRALQAGLYPNPILSVTGDELGDVQGPGGIWTAPHVSQEIVTGGKLRLSRAAAGREVDQATLALAVQRYTLLASVRQAYFEVLALERRAELLSGVLDLVEKAVEQTRAAVAAKQLARLSLVQLQAEAARVRADRDATRRELPGAYQRLAAVAGVPRMPIIAISGTLDAPLPTYDPEAARRLVIDSHPEVRSAQAGVERARLLLRRAEVEPIPNVTVGAGYMRQNQNKSDDWTLGVSVPVPLWNRNQGNVYSARAQLAEAVQEVGRVQADLADRLAAALRDYAAARERAEQYRTKVLPLAKEAADISLAAYEKGGQFEYLQVLQAQRTLAEANVEYARALGDAWRAAATLSGLLLNDSWVIELQGPKPGDSGR